jgi:hypothetical protein
MLIGYVRVSTQDQNLALQREALQYAGCKRIYEDHLSAVHAQRPGLAQVLDALRSGDMLVVWKLDRLGRSVKSLVDLVGELAQRDVHFKSLTDSIDTGTPAGRFFFHRRRTGYLATFARPQRYSACSPACSLTELQRDELQPANLGLSIAESNWLEQHRRCEKCDAELRCKGHHTVVLRTVFGKMNIQSPRLYQCPCEEVMRASFSPLAEFLPERSTPEMKYLETKWASLMSYGMTLDLLKEVLPVSEDLSTTAIRKAVAHVAQRLCGYFAVRPRVSHAQNRLLAERPSPQNSHTLWVHQSPRYQAEASSS